jgi:hypothetical protein
VTHGDFVAVLLREPVFVTHGDFVGYRIPEELMREAINISKGASTRTWRVSAKRR